jgi:hypothetical protein
MDRCGDHLAPEEAPVASLRALGQHGEAGPALAQRPLQKRVVAAAHNRGRLGGKRARGAYHPGEQPAVEIGA